MQKHSQREEEEEEEDLATKNKTNMKWNETIFKSTLYTLSHSSRIVMQTNHRLIIPEHPLRPHAH